MVYTEWNTLAGRPIRSTPFEYRFGEFADDAHSGPVGDAAKPPRRARRILRQLEKPSSEVQTDAIGLQVVSAIGGALGTLAMASAGWPPGAYVPFAGAAAAIAGVSTYEALRKLRYEKPYGDFFSASVSVASADVVDGSGRVLVRRGIDEICELHAINNLKRMSELSRQGLAGRMRIAVETLEGLRALIADMGDPAYSDVSYVVARSGITNLLFKVGFDEIEHPVPYDFINRWDKQVLMWVISLRVGRQLSGDVGSYRMALMPKERFASAGMAAAIDGQIERAHLDLARALRLSHSPEAPAPEATALPQGAGERAGAGAVAPAYRGGPL
jgi:hypothetical protein